MLLIELACFSCVLCGNDDDDGCCWLLIAASLPLSRSRSASFTQFLLSSFPIISLLALLYQLKTIRFARRRCLIIYTVYNMFLLGRARDDVFSVYFGFTYIHTQLRSHFTSVHSVLSIHCEQFGSVAHSDFNFFFSRYLSSFLKYLRVSERIYFTRSRWISYHLFCGSFDTKLCPNDITFNTQNLCAQSGTRTIPEKLCSERFCMFAK